MTVSEQELSLALEVLGPAKQHACLDDVREQTSVFYLDHWKKRWPAVLELPAILNRPEPKLSVSRDNLFTLGESIETEDDAVRFYVAVCAWGAGSSAQQVDRCLRPLGEIDAPQRLLTGLRLAKTETADEGYRAFNNYNRNRIKFLGPAFFTKLLYFAAGSPKETDTRHPLILDMKVARSLGWKKTSGWSTDEYTHYLDVVEELQRRWCPELPTDVIEYTLFYGGAIAPCPNILSTPGH